MSHRCKQPECVVCDDLEHRVYTLECLDRELSKYKGPCTNKPLQGEIGNWKCSNKNCTICV